MNWHERVLDAKGKKAAARLAAATGKQFYLAGGTALALRLGHRVSLDLDLFSEKNRLGAAERASILEALKSSGKTEVLENKDGTCHLRLEGTSASLFHYPYPPLKPAQAWKGLRVASEEDIAAMKLSAAVGRGSRKDFIDLYFLCRRLGLDAVLGSARARFPDHPQFVLQAARALVYFEDAEKEPLPRLLAPLSWSGVKAYFEAEVPKSVKRNIAGD